MNSKTYPSGAVVYDIPCFVDDRGGLNALELGRDVPFDCRRVFYTYAVPGGVVRGEHAHRRCDQFLVAIRGRVVVRVDDGEHVDEIVLDSPSTGLMLPAGRWGSQSCHSEDCVLLVLASLPYDNADYIRTYDEFCAWKSEGGAV